MSKSILITGATGYLGSEILKMCCDSMFSVIIVTRINSNTRRINDYLSKIRVYNTNQIEEIFEENRIDIVIHCANSYGKEKNTYLGAVETNLLFALKIFDLSIRHEVRHFVNISTVLNKGINEYSLSKNQFKEWVFLKKNVITTINLDLEYFYGDNDDNWKLIPSVLASLQNKEEYINFTSGIEERRIIEITDVIEAVSLVINEIEYFKETCCIEIVGPDRLRIKEVMILLKEMTKNKTTKLNFGRMPDRDITDVSFSYDKVFLEKYGWNPDVGVKQGLQNLIKNNNRG